MPLCRCFDEGLNPNALRLFQDVAAWAGARPPVLITRTPADATAEARVLDAGNGKKLVIAINHSEARASMDLTIPVSPETKVSNLLTGEPLELRSVDTRGHAQASIDLLPAGVRVLLVEK